MPAADDLPSLSPAQWTVWLGTAVVVHLIWGFHPVFSRWLQTRAAVPVDGLNLLGVCQLFALLVNLAVSRLAAPCGRSCGCGGSSGGPPSKMTATPTTAVARQTFTRERVICASLIGAAYATRAATNIVSSRFTVATNIALVQLAAPFVNGVAAWLVLRERVDRSLAYALAASTLGVTAAVVGQMDSAPQSVRTGDSSSQQRAAFGWVDALGMLLQAVSLLFSTAQRLLMRTSKDLFEPLQFTRIQYCATILVCLAWSLGHGSVVWQTWAHLGVIDWVMVFGLAVGVFFFGSTGQVAAVRRLGLGTYACLQPVRLIGSAVGSAVILGEPVSSTLEWLGLFVVMATTLAYALHQRTIAVRTSNQSYQMVASQEDEDEGEDSDGDVQAQVCETASESGQQQHSDDEDKLDKASSTTRLQGQV